MIENNKIMQTCKDAKEQRRSFVLKIGQQTTSWYGFIFLKSKVGEEPS